MATFFQSVFFANLIIIATAIEALGQEYDDLYFNKNDRKKTPLASVSTNFDYSSNKKNHSSTSFLGKLYQQQTREIHTPTEVNKESIDRYKRSNLDRYTEYQRNEKEEIADPTYSNLDQTLSDREVTINNYYGVEPRANNGFGQGWRFGTRWGNWGNNLWASYGWNSFWNPWYFPSWGFYNGFWNDPWYGFGFNTWGFNRWGGFYDPLWCPPYYGYPYNGYYYKPVVVSNSGESGQVVQRGPRNARGGDISSRENNRGNQRLQESSVANNNAHTNDIRDFSQQQSKYLNKSRKSMQMYNTQSSSSSISSRRSPSTNTSRRSTNSSNGYRNTNSSSSTIRHSTPSNRTQRSGSRSYAPNRSSSRSSGSNRTFKSSRSSRPSSGVMRSSGSSRSSSGRSGGGSRQKRGH